MVVVRVVSVSGAPRLLAQEPDEELARHAGAEPALPRGPDELQALGAEPVQDEPRVQDEPVERDELQGPVGVVELGELAAAGLAAGSCQAGCCCRGDCYCCWAGADWAAAVPALPQAGLA